MFLNYQDVIKLKQNSGNPERCSMLLFKNEDQKNEDKACFFPLSSLKLNLLIFPSHSRKKSTALRKFYLKYNKPHSNLVLPNVKSCTRKPLPKVELKLYQLYPSNQYCGKCSQNVSLQFPTVTSCRTNTR